MKQLPYPVLLAAAAASLLTTQVRAGNVIKANNSDALALTTSWSAGVVPGANDVAVWNSSVLSANTVALGGNLSWQGIKLTNVGGRVIINEPTNTNVLTLGSGGIDMTTAIRNLTLNHSITVGSSQDWNVASGRALTVVSGAARNVILDGDLTIKGAGDVVFGGSTGNPIVSGAGKIIIDGGTLTNQIQAGGNSTGRSGATILNSGNLIITSNVSLFGTGTLELNGGAIGSGTAAQRTVTNAIKIDGDIGVGGAGFSTGSMVFNGATDLTGTTSTLTVSAATTFAGVISNGGLTKVGTSTLTFTGANTYTGGTIVGEGTLLLNGAGALADTSALSLSTGSTLSIAGITSSLEKVGSLTGAPGSTVDLGAKTLEVGTAENTTFSGLIEGTGGSLTKAGNGTFTLNGVSTNTYTGTTSITGGTLLLGNDNVLPDFAAFGLSSGAQLSTGGFSDVTGSAFLSGNGVIDLGGGSGTSVLTFGSIGSWSGVLSIWNWNGSPNNVGTTGLDTRLLFLSGTLDAAQLANVRFYSGGEGSPEIGTGTLVSIGGGASELIAVPEPSSVLMASLGLLTLLYRRR